MKIAKPMLLVATPIGVAGGLYEGYRLAGGLVFLMVAFIALIGAALWSVVRVIRREQRAQLPGPPDPPDTDRPNRDAARR